MFQFTQSWFLHSAVKHLLLQFVNGQGPNRVLEIGCFEGQSSVHYADNLLNHPESRMTCVDPFMKTEHNDHEVYLQNNEEANFDHNISICNNANKITVHKITSDEFFKSNTDTYNFIYIDGCHYPDFISRDMDNSFRALEVNGIMWMDDYLYGETVTVAMDNMLEKFKGHCDIIHKGGQLAIRKTSNL